MGNLEFSIGSTCCQYEERCLLDHPPCVRALDVLRTAVFQLHHQPHTPSFCSIVCSEQCSLSALSSRSTSYFQLRWICFAYSSSSITPAPIYYVPLSGVVSS